MEHLNSLILGLCADERQHCTSILIPHKTLSLEERLNNGSYFLGQIDIIKANIRNKLI